MKSTTPKNPYEHLRLDVLSDYEAVPAQSAYTVTKDREETVSILAAVLPDGYWCYGYTVYWRNGRCSHANPDPSLGLFATQREAQLYALGFMSLFASYFTEATNLAILQAVAEKSQASLFN